MYTSRWIAAGSLTVALLATAAGAASSAMALPMEPIDPSPSCSTGYHWDDDLMRCVRNSTTTGRTPTLAVDVVRQTTSLNGIRVAGWTADPDQPTTALTVRITVDGATARTLTANVNRPDVAAAYPSYGAYHGYDVVVPASNAGHTVCVYATSVGGGADAGRCTAMDDILEFQANSITYDTGATVITNTNIEQLEKVTNYNSTTVQQSTEISGSKSVTESRGWSDQVGVKVTAKTQVKIPLIGSTDITVEGSVQFTQNGSTSETHSFSWRQPVLVPAKSKVVATVSVTKSTLSVPYTMAGNYVYRSGAQAAGSIGGVYTGVSSHDLQITLTQFNLDGTPAARAVDQPSASLLRDAIS
jgi:hypothetical protein